MTNDDYGMCLAGHGYKQRKARFEIGQQLGVEHFVGGVIVFHDKQRKATRCLKHAFGCTDIDA